METGKIPPELRYTKSHEWLRIAGTSVTVGITDHAQSQLTDIVFVDLPAAGKAIAKGASALVLESVKTVADVYAPGAGTIAEANASLKAHPEHVNQDPYGKGWLFRLDLSGSLDETGLLSADEYRAHVLAGG
ncbi:MAG TPA: glycine cleavage system protein GcvH [Thermoplasmata archaeon]|nr:glycine cleavage system protein GcvH [Thermoplasmata archaeon]